MTDILAKSLACVFVLILGWLACIIKDYISNYLKESENEKLKELVATFVSAAEQLYKNEEHSGEAKKLYVLSELASLGHEFSEYLDALIESAVYKLK